jgi:hypothetical protein
MVILLGESRDADQPSSLIGSRAKNTSAGCGGAPSRTADPFAAIAASIEYNSVRRSGRRQSQNGLTASPVCDRGDWHCPDDLRNLRCWL